MSIDELIAALRDLDAMLYVNPAGALRYAGPQLPADDPIRAALREHRALLIELFTYAPAGRCVADACYRLQAEGADRCPDHLEAVLMTDHDDGRACRDANGVCQDSTHQHFDFDEYRAEREDAYLERGSRTEAA